MEEKKEVVDHYLVLGLPTGEEGAKLEEKDITKAYRAKALELHPDKRPNDPNANAEFQRLNASYKILHDPKARKQFDSSLRLENNKPSEPPPSQNEERLLYLFLFGLLIFVLAPMVSPEYRTIGSTCNRVDCYIRAFFDLRQLDLWSRMVRLGRYFKRRPRPPSPPQATTNQNQKIQDDEGNHEPRVEDHEDIEDWVMV